MTIPHTNGTLAGHNLAWKTTMRPLLLLMLTWLFTSPALADQHVQHIVSDQTAALSLPFSDGVQVGNIIFMSGTLGVTPADTGLYVVYNEVDNDGLGIERKEFIIKFSHILDLMQLSPGQRYYHYRW
jgi:hypothetical protein